MQAAVALNVCLVGNQCTYVLRVTFTKNVKGLVCVVQIHRFKYGWI